MNQNALMVIADEPGTFHWVLLSVDGHSVKANSQSEGEFNDYQAALDAGAQALAALDQQPYENEPADSAEDASVAAAIAPLG